MKKQKYIRTKWGFIIFPETMQHSVFKNRFDIISAGFCQIDTEAEICSCFGDSFSLGLKSLTGDSEDMKRQLFTYF